MNLPCQCRRTFRRLVNAIVYARNGRELIGLKSPVSVPMLSENLALITSRRQGCYRQMNPTEGVSCRLVMGEPASKFQLLELSSIWNKWTK